MITVKWIPCSERMPDLKPDCYYADDGSEMYESEEVLVWGGLSNESYGYGLATLILDKENGTFHWCGVVDYLWDAFQCEIIAWCPLPKPYEAADLPIAKAIDMFSDDCMEDGRADQIDQVREEL